MAGTPCASVNTEITYASCWLNLRHKYV